MSIPLLFERIVARFRDLAGGKDEPAFQYAVAVVAASLGCAGVAEDRYRRAVAAEPECIEAHYGLGLLHMEAERYGEALSEFTIALRGLPGSLQVQRELLKSARALGAFGDAREAFRVAAASEPYDPHLHAGLATLSLEMGEIEEALSEFRRSLEIDPAFLPALRSLGAMLLAARSFDDAVQFLERAAGIDPDHAPTHRKLALALEGRGDSAAAERHRLRAAALERSAEGCE